MQDLSEDLIRMAAQGDMHAFEIIYRNTSGFVYSLALRTLGHAEDAREVTQDVFVKIYRELRNFRHESSFKTWIYRIAVNTAINASIKRSREAGRRGGYDEALRVESGDSEAPGRNIERQDAERKLAALLKRLSPDQRACLILREIEELSYQEIAKILNINLNTVRTRIRRAREALLNLGRKSEVIYEM